MLPEFARPWKRGARHSKRSVYRGLESKGAESTGYMTFRYMTFREKTVRSEKDSGTLPQMLPEF